MNYKRTSGYGTHNESGGTLNDYVNGISEKDMPYSLDPMSEQVGGSHYKDMGIQPLEATYLNYGYEGVEAAIYTKVNKYFRNKGDKLENLHKAAHCIDMLIDFREREDD